MLKEGSGLRFSTNCPVHLQLCQRNGGNPKLLRGRFTEKGRLQLQGKAGARFRDPARVPISSGLRAVATRTRKHH